MSREEAIVILDKALDKLGEHFDAVQILASNAEGGITDFIPRGAGNFYARKGMAQTFCERDAAEDSAIFIAKELKESE